MDDSRSQISLQAGMQSQTQGIARQLLASKELGIFVVLVVMVILIGLRDASFISIESFSNVGQRASWYGIIALGTVFLLSMGEIDLSIGSNYAVCINVAAILMVEPLMLDPWLTALIGIIVGILLGAVNGLLSNFLKIPAIIITLGTLSVYRGLALIVSGGRFVYGVPREHAFFTTFGSEPFGIPMSIWAFVVLTILLAVIYRYTRYGFMVKAIGSNPKAARLSGIPIPTIRFMTLVIQGALCGISAMLTLAFFSTADPNLGTGYELQAIAAAIIGGTALSGGRGTIVGALLGALVIAVISSGITRFGVSANYSVFVTGVVILIAVAVDALIRRRQEQRS